jgi:hypothetical protein
VDAGRVWIFAFVLGGAGTLLLVFGTLGALVGLVLAIAVIRRSPHHLAVLSGLLTGVGGLWSYLMIQIFTTGGNQDNGTFWLVVGLVPLAVGLTLLVFVVRRGHANGSSTT